MTIFDIIEENYIDACREADNAWLAGDSVAERRWLSAFWVFNDILDDIECEVWND